MFFFSTEGVFSPIKSISGLKNTPMTQEQHDAYHSDFVELSPNGHNSYDQGVKHTQFVTSASAGVQSILANSNPATHRTTPETAGTAVLLRALLDCR